LVEDAELRVERKKSEDEDEDEDDDGMLDRVSQLAMEMRLQFFLMKDDQQHQQLTILFIF
jgi:hypothetical protein